MTELWWGKELALEIRTDAQTIISQSSISPRTLTILLTSGSAEALDYTNFISKSAGQIGLVTQVVTVNNAQELYSATQESAKDPQVGGIIVQRPYPADADESRLQALLPVEKDVDGLSFESLGRLFSYQPEYVPCTAEAMLRIMKSHRLELVGKKVVIVGRSLAVGRPLWALLLAEHATITVCHTRTKNLAGEVAQAEVLCVAAGKAGLITPDMVNSRMIVVDAGYNYLEDGTGPLGDCHPQVGEMVKAYTPVPGGVGTITTAVLLLHSARSAAVKAE
jgi:methylenetetrahydrofolate dehydrogenase (NADP+)/methenyltetrahydrofolate cyclohydrolase